jgi:Mrp family chromosome partitioning ATPase
VLIGDADPLTFVQPTETENLSVLPAGHTPPNPAELLESVRAQAAMATLRERFDAIVVDSPAHPYPDVLPLATLCDASLLVIRLGSSRRRDGRAAADQLAVVGRPPIGLIANRC